MNFEKLSEQDCKWLNSFVLDFAIRGNIDCVGPIDINWNTVNGYVFVYIEEYPGNMYYRIFYSSDSYNYERKRILNPVEDSEDFAYLYGFYKNYEKDKLFLEMCRTGNWLQEIRDLENEI